MKRVLSIVLCLMLLCGCAYAEFNEPGAFPICTEKVHLKIAVPEHSNIADYETDGMTLLLEERGGFDLEFMVLASSEYVTKVNLMMQGNDPSMPDIFLFNGSADIESLVFEWADIGAIVPLTEYYEDAAISYWLHDAMERTGVDVAAQMTMPDGEIYSVPVLNQSYTNEYPSKLWYFEPWFESLNVEIPTTTEELYNVLKLIKESDCNGNGIADEIPLAGTSFGTNTSGSGGWFAYLMNAFVYAGDRNFFTVDDGVVSVAYTTDAWKEGLKYISRLVADGLVAPESLTMDGAQLSSINSAERVLFSSTGIAYTGGFTNAEEGYHQWKAFPPMIGPEGVQYASYEPSVATSKGVVTADCANPEAAFRFLDLMTSEYFSIIQRWGLEDEDWNYADKVPHIEEYKSAYTNFPVYIVAYHLGDFDTCVDEKYKSHGWRQVGPYIRQYAIANGSGKNASNITGFTINSSAGYTLYQEGGYAPAEVIPKLMFNLEENEAVGDILVTAKSYVCEMAAAFISGNRDIDAEWDSYLAELNNIGIDKIISTVQSVYDRMYK